ncbi:MAG: hypothetical protein ACXV3C_08525 [Actinomycetes bacterium]
MARRHLSARGLAATVAVVLAAVLLPAQGAPAATGVSVSKYFFGMHDSAPESWPRANAGWAGAGVGSLRLWDSGVTWRDIETSPGSFSWTRLDALLRVANAHRAQVTLVLGQTPEFHAVGARYPGCGLPGASFSNCSRLGTAASSVPDVAAWRAYVREVATHVRGRVAALQVWNEANVFGYWAGSMDQMALLTGVAREEVNAVNATPGPRLALVAPAFLARSNLYKMAEFYGKSYNRFRMGQLVDKVSVQLYPGPKGTPEDSITNTKVGLPAVKKILATNKVTKPIWNTEVNYGMAGGGTGVTPPPISSARQAAYVVRTYVLNANARIERVFWYAWDLQSIGNTHLSTAGGTPTQAGKAFGLTQSWLYKARLKSCVKYTRGAYKGIYVCTLTYSGGVKRIYWNTHPTKKVKVTMPRTATYRVSLYGKKTKIKGGSKQYVDYRPVLVRSKK